MSVEHQLDEEEHRLAIEKYKYKIISGVGGLTLYPLYHAAGRYSLHVFRKKWNVITVYMNGRKCGEFSFEGFVSHLSDRENFKLPDTLRKAGFDHDQIIFWLTVENDKKRTFYCLDAVNGEVSCAEVYSGLIKFRQYL